ncbi:hypothetical protein G6F57_017208 [Rhizopus arrhizus]|nr:hypothetical protein G6F57_017208 [Rhizopus arrhizus]
MGWTARLMPASRACDASWATTRNNRNGSRPSADAATCSAARHGDEAHALGDARPRLPLPALWHRLPGRPPAADRAWPVGVGRAAGRPHRSRPAGRDARHPCVAAAPLRRNPARTVAGAGARTRRRFRLRAAHGAAGRGGEGTACQPAPAVQQRPCADRPGAHAQPAADRRQRLRGNAGAAGRSTA